MSAPTLDTQRLLLRPFTVDDIPQLLPLIGAREIAATTRNIPHPYSRADAEKFIGADHGSDLNVAIVRRADGQLIGGGILRPEARDASAEVGYWIGVPYWRNGFASEAAGELIRYGFEDLKLHRVYAFHSGNNPASGKVLQKLGMKHEGTMRQHQRKWGEYLDIEVYGLLKAEWDGRGRPSSNS